MAGWAHAVTPEVDLSDAIFLKCEIFVRCFIYLDFKWLILYYQTKKKDETDSFLLGDAEKYIY